MTSIWQGSTPVPAGYMGAASANALVFVDADGIQRADPAKVGYNESTKVLTFGDAGGRFQADFSDALFANRMLFQSDVPDGVSYLGVLPNGTGGTAGYTAFSGTDPDNATVLRMQVTVSGAQLQSGKTGTGTWGPLVIQSPASLGGLGEIARFGEGNTLDCQFGGVNKGFKVIGATNYTRWVEVSGSNGGSPMIKSSAGSLDIGSPVLFTSQNVGTAVGAAGGASALPATPLGYLSTFINGTACRIPYYN